MTTHTAALSASQAKALRVLLDLRSWEIFDKEWCLYGAKKATDKVSLAVYEKGPKVVIQGKGTEEFVRFILEPEILGLAELDYATSEIDGQIRTKTSAGGGSGLDPAQLVSHIGVDESGKGDVFGPLVIAAVHTEGEIAEKLSAAGLTDSKKIGSDAKIRQLAGVVRKSAVAYEVIVITPPRYNELHPKFGANLNRLLAWGHARSIASLAERVADCRRALSDQFARGPVLKNALAKFPEAAAIKLEERTKAESDIAVAAASVLARAAFIDWLQKHSHEQGITLPRGASPQVRAALDRLIDRDGPSVLRQLAKMHFKTVKEALIRSDCA